jgi:hypothetical protein
MNWIIERLKEPSTYRGLAGIGGLVGLAFSPAQWEAISAAVVAVLSAIELFRSEKKV